jgi:hypothetical protein
MSKNGAARVATRSKPAQVAKTDPTAVASRPQIPKRIRKHINEAFADQETVTQARYPGNAEAMVGDIQAAKKEVLAYINGLLKNQKPAV